MNPQNLKEVLSAEKCKTCKLRIKLYSKAWCTRCLDIFYRGQLEQNLKEKCIIAEVGERYMNAQVSDLEGELKDLDISWTDNLFLYGNVGSGKTYAMAALLRKYVYRGYDCRRINFDDFCVQVRSTYQPSSKQTEWELIKSLIECDMLFIDDLGLRAKTETDFVYVTLYSLLNKRQEKMLPTVISSNKSIEQLEQTFDSRIASRLAIAKQIKFEGKDRRMKGGGS